MAATGSEEKSRLARIGAWFDERLHFTESILPPIVHPVPKNAASWAYVFGSATMLCLVMQILTGICLALVYAPAADEGSQPELSEHGSERKTPEDERDDEHDEQPVEKGAQGPPGGGPSDSDPDSSGGGDPKTDSDSEPEKSGERSEESAAGQRTNRT